MKTFAIYSTACCRKLHWPDVDLRWKEFTLRKRKKVDMQTAPMTPALRVNMRETLSGIEFTEQGEQGFS